MVIYVCDRLKRDTTVIVSITESIVISILFYTKLSKWWVYYISYEILYIYFVSMVTLIQINWRKTYNSGRID